MQKSMLFSMLFFIITICTAPVIVGSEQQIAKAPAIIPSLKELCLKRVTWLFNTNPSQYSFTVVPQELAAEVIEKCNYEEVLCNKKRKTEIAGLLPQLESAKRMAIGAKIQKINNREAAINAIHENQSVEDWCQSYYGKDILHVLRGCNSNSFSLQVLKNSSPKTQKIALVILWETQKVYRNHQPQSTLFYIENLQKLEPLSPTTKNPCIKRLMRTAKTELSSRKKAAKRLFE